jgi:hypothetical protein
MVNSLDHVLHCNKTLVKDVEASDKEHKPFAFQYRQRFPDLDGASVKP